MENARKDNKIKLIILYVLSVSIFLAFLPIDDGGYFGLFVHIFQIVLIIVYYYLFNNSRRFYEAVIYLIGSNIVFSIIVGIILQNDINNVKTTEPHQMMDMMGIVMAQAALAIMQCLSIVHTANVLIIGIIAIIIRKRKDKKLAVKEYEE